MTDVVFLYISAANDLELERDLLGRVVTEIPTTLGWRIVQTPRIGDPLNTEAIIRSDVHLLLLGSDIRAPIGLEWSIARRARRMPYLFLKKDIPRTPAAQAFVREIQKVTNWRLFLDNADLRYQVLSLLTEHLIAHSGYYELKAGELHQLNAYRDEIHSEREKHIEATRGGAGESSVILSVERFIPTNGTLIKAPNKKQQAN